MPLIRFGSSGVIGLRAQFCKTSGPFEVSLAPHVRFQDGSDGQRVLSEDFQAKCFTLAASKRGAASHLSAASGELEVISEAAFVIC